MFLFPHGTFFLLSFFLLINSCPFSLAFYLPDSNPLLSFNSQVREVRLYTENHRRGMYLQMSQDGTVSGSDAQTPFSVLELKSVKPGHIVIKGHSSSLFLCADRHGSLRGQRLYTETECTFRELLLADGYTRFLSSQYGFPVSLASKHATDQHALPFTRFLPIKGALTRESVPEQPINTERPFDLDSDDLLGMGQSSMHSPHFSLDK
ncbi:fibroblast growth factor 21 [Aulostomus maculatus]